VDSLNTIAQLPIRPEGHGLILKITFATLIADGTIERVVDEQKLHDTLTCLSREVRICFDAPPFHNGHGAGGHRLGGLLDLDETHSAVAGDRETLVVAKTRNFNTDQGGSLKCL